VQYRTMGSLPWKVSALGFGCMRLPTKGLLRGVDERTAIDIIRYGIDRGINYLDTAWLYHLGHSERVLGLALKDGYRDKVKLATKLPMVLVRSPDAFERYLEQQLQRLQTDHLDVYLFHSMDQGQFEKLQRLELMARMEKARSQGKVRHIGFSFHDTLPVFKRIVDYYAWDMTLIQHNYMDTTIQASSEGLRYAHGKGLAVVIMEPLKGGYLARPPAEAMALIRGAPVSRTPADWALQFLWNQPEVACVLSGMGSRRDVEQNCASADVSGVGKLSDAESRVIEQLAETYRRKIVVPCTACGYCMPCPSGVDIPQNFALLNNKALGKGGTFSNGIVQWMVTRGYRRLAATPKALARSGNRGRASLCTRCNACVPKCPQHIAIPDELIKVTEAFR
jgi:uncharacterized protein